MNKNFDERMDMFKESIQNISKPFEEILDIFSNPFVSFIFVSLAFAIILLLCVLKYKKKAFSETKRPRTLAICAMMMALNIILGYYEIRFSSYLRIGFGFITQPIVASLFGPIVGCMTGMLQDFLSFVLHPTGGYIPAYTMCVGISGMIYGLMLYNKPVSLVRIFITKLLIAMFSNVVLNTIALAPTVGSGFIGIFPARLVKNLLMIPIQTVVVYFVLKYIMPHIRKDEVKTV